MADQVYTSKKSGALWIQPDGPGTKPYYLPCHDLDDMTESDGTITLIQCINELGQYQTLGATEDPPEPTTTTLTTYIGAVADWLEKVRGKCPFALYVHLNCGGRKDVFNTWERSYILEVRKISGITRSGLVRKDEDTPAMHSFDIEAYPNMLSFSKIAVQPNLLANGSKVTSVKFWDVSQCWDGCGESLDNCSYGVAVTGAVAAAAGQVYIKKPNVAGWVSTADAPFDVNEDIADVILVNIGLPHPRIITARGTTDALNPMEIAYSDDEGATWVNVNVGSVNGQYAIKRGALNSLGLYDNWLATTDGYIYYSSDGGLTWTAQSSGDVTAEDLNYIEFIDPQHGYAVGNNGASLGTVDGGLTWATTETSPAAENLLSISVISQKRYAIGGQNGKIYLTQNSGRTWSTLTVVATASPVEDLQFKGAYYGNAALSGASPGVYQTINGGFDWLAYSRNTVTNDHLAVWTCNETNVWFGAGNGTDEANIGFVGGP